MSVPTPVSAMLTMHERRRTEINAIALAQLEADLYDAPAGCRRFFTTLFSVGDSVAQVEHLGRLLGVWPSTLISRFARAHLPSPKAYLSWARLVRAAALLENPRVSFAAAAMALEYSSPQAFSRHLKWRLGLTGPAFRRTYDGEKILARFRQELIVPYLPALVAFSPFGDARRAASPASNV